MNKLKSKGEFKATQKGNLSQVFVRELYEEFFRQEDFFDRTPRTEEDVPEIVLLRSLLEFAGIIKKRSNKFTLTKKGELLLQSVDIHAVYVDLFYACMNEWNWACLDNYQDLNLIQNSSVFNFYLLHVKAQDWILNEDLGCIYLEAFPHLINEVPQRAIWSPEEEFINCFNYRFLKNVCQPLGLIEIREEGENIFERKEYSRVSSFFKNSFRFNTSF